MLSETHQDEDEAFHCNLIFPVCVILLIEQEASKVNDLHPFLLRTGFRTCRPISIGISAHFFALGCQSLPRSGAGSCGDSSRRMTLVFNAYPLIVLAKAGLPQEVLTIGDKIIIPEAVAHEVSAVDAESDPSRLWVNSPEAKQLLMDTPPISPFIGAWDLSPG